jgi:hypothetical protein
MTHSSSNSSQAFFPFDDTGTGGSAFDGNSLIPLVLPQYNTINKIVSALENALALDMLIITESGGIVYDSNGTIVTKKN